MNRRVVECSRCEKQLYAYPSESGPFYCETARCESTEPQNTEKRPGLSRQEDHRAATDSDTHEGASAVNKSTATPASHGTIVEDAHLVAERNGISVQDAILTIGSHWFSAEVIPEVRDMDTEDRRERLRQLFVPGDDTPGIGLTLHERAELIRASAREDQDDQSGEQDVDEADTEQPAATYSLTGGQARLTLHSHAPQDPGVVRLWCETSAGDAVVLQMRHCQAQDLADWLFTSVDRIAAEEEAAADAAVDADEARMIAEGGATLWTLGKVLAAEDGLTTETVIALGDALDVTPVFLFETITAARLGMPWSTMPTEDRLLRMGDLYVTAKTLGVQPSDIAATVLETTDEKGAEDDA